MLLIVLAQVANVFACRSDRLSVTRSGWFSNPLILWGIAIEAGVRAIIVTNGNLVAKGLKELAEEIYRDMPGNVQEPRVAARRIA